MQQLAAVVAPKLMGGLAAKTPLGDLGYRAMDQVMQLESPQWSGLGDDWLIQASSPG